LPPSATTRLETTLARLVLLDANVILEAFRLGIWDLLVTKAQVSIASTVVGEVDHYFDPVTGQKTRIDLQSYITTRKVAVEQGDAVRMAAVRGACERYMELHIGEVESIAVVADAGVKFCTADHAAAKAMALLDLSEQATSFEGVLRKHGITPKLKMKPHFSTATMNTWLKEGSILRVQTFGKKP